MEQETLKGAAEAEANLAEAELKNRPKRKKAKANGKAKSNGAAAATSKPGDQGVATQHAPAEDKAPPVWERPDVSKKDRTNAEAVFMKLESDAQDMGAEAVIDALVAIVDVFPELTIPHQWPGEAGEEYRESPVIERIALLLCRGCPKIQVSGR